ncbi:MerR family transcriptional regulator [Streptomyces sp. NPDC050704]|uniref:MerR family transcriptional regulator n=1 Tax=Streptomyces sp. NPDC050704 TaxID=3157219 RepID=UPI00343EB7E2
MGDRLRAVDLARAAGISTQQVRNYVETGILPPVERTDSGYRVFTTAHAEALTAAREMAAGHGWPTTGAVMRAVHGDDLETALAVLDASHAELHRERAELAEALHALDTILVDPTALGGSEEVQARPLAAGHALSPHRPKPQVAPLRETSPGMPRARTERRRNAPALPRSRPAAPGEGLRIGEVADAIGVQAPVLRLWEERGLLRPTREKATGYRRYSASEALLAQVVVLLRRGNHSFATIASVLTELRATGSPERVRAELAGREREVHHRSLSRLRGSAALHTYLRQRTRAI